MNFRKYILFLFVIFVCSLDCIVIETASFQDFLFGTTDACEYDHWVSHISEGLANDDYNIYAPWDVQTNGFGDFLLAGADTLDTWGTIVETFLLGNYTEAQLLIDTAGFPYTVVEFNDIDTGRTFYLLRETLNMDYFDDNGTVTTVDDEIGSFDFGWGLYVHNPAAVNQIIVNVVHPNDDFIAPILALDCFNDWNAQFFIINGAGRETKWTEQGSYTNSKSLSDPSRNSAHAFNIFYQQACDKIRDEFGRQEFSMQLHSYDWDRHDNHPDCQISAGNGRSNPNLPMRDLSDLHEDFINRSQHLMLPSNTIGEHEAVYLNDYYSVNYSLYEYNFYEPNGRSYPVNDDIDLPGYSGSKQMQYSTQGWNHYDVFEPFYHLEMDELPNCYEETEANYWMFYGYNFAQQNFQLDQRYVKVREYFSHWVNAMTETLPFTIQLDDGLVPDIPQNPQLTEIAYNKMTLTWEYISSYDFRTYEILYSTQPIASGNYETVTRDDFQQLASPRTESYTFYNLELNQQYYFQIRAVDYNGNTSELSTEVSAYTAPVVTSTEKAAGLDSEVLIHWNCSVQSGNQGFNVYKRVDGEFVVLDSWQSNPDLLGSNQPQIYEFIDTEVYNNTSYTYAVSCQNLQGTEYWVSQQLYCRPAPIYDIIVSNATGSIVDTVSFGKNFYASNNIDFLYDLEKAGTPIIDYVYAAFYEPDLATDETYLRREMYGNFNERVSFRNWELRIATDQLDQLINIKFDPASLPISSKLYLLDYETGILTNLLLDDYQYYAEDSEFKELRLIWGNYGPYAYIGNSANRIYRAGDVIDFNWQLGNTSLIEYQRLYLFNETDTLEIASHLNKNAEDYSWLVPDNILFHNAQFGLDVISREGDINSANSSYRLGIVPTELTLSKASGWNTISNPWLTDANLTTASVFGTSAELYEFIDHEQYQSSDEFVFGKGYWCYSPTGYDYSAEYPIVENSIMLPMTSGWNLMTNPHPISFDKKNMRFHNGFYTLQYTSAVQNAVIPYCLYVYRENEYVSVSEVKPFESFFIYANIAVGEEFQINFYPYYSAFNQVVEELSWQGKITAAQLEKDELVFGTSTEAGEGFDFLYDLPEPPAKPFDNSTNLYFEKDIGQTADFLYRRLNREIKSTMVPDSTQSVEWNFELLIDLADAVTLEFDLSQLPAGFTVDIALDGNSWCNLVNNVYVYSFSPTQTGELQGSIVVHNNVARSLDVYMNETDLACYPNPFNPITSTQFSLNRESLCELTVYNLKGQKVKEVFSGKLQPGVHRYSWNGKNEHDHQAASGIYFIKLKTGQKIITKKVLLMK